MTAVPIPRGMADLTEAWLTAAVGPSFGSAVVTKVVREQIGTGQIADSVRLALSWDPPDAGPATLVAKVTSASEVSREAAMRTRTYEVEGGLLPRPRGPPAGPPSRGDDMFVAMAERAGLHAIDHDTEGLLV